MAAVVWDIGVGSYPSYLSPPQLFHRPYILVNATVHAPPLSLTHLAFTGCGFESGSSTSSLSWRTKCYMEVHLIYRTAPSYLGPLVRVADVPGRRALRSAGTNRILVPPVTSTTVGSRAFPVAASLIWNSLSDDVISA